MLSFFSERMQKQVSLFLLLVMYFETVLPSYLFASVGYEKTTGKRYDNYSLNSLKSLNDGPDSRNPDLDELYPNANTSKTTFDDGRRNKTRSINQSPEKKFIGGPGQPEMSSFKSVGTSDMVDLFSGDFSYNIPLLDVGGYPVNIHYNAGVSMDQEASWVGLGWNINPGVINRTMRGMPDDFNGQDKISREQNIALNRTVGVTVGAGFEVFGKKLKLNASLGVFRNTYRGWGVTTGINANIDAGNFIKGPLTASLGINNNSQNGLDVSPGLMWGLSSANNNMQGSVQVGTNYNSRSGISGLQLTTEVRAFANMKLSDHSMLRAGTGFGIPSFISFAIPSYVPTIQMPLTSTQFTFSVQAPGLEKAGTFTNVRASGYVSKQEIDPKDRKQILPAFGYLYYSQAANQPLALLDYNREKEIAFNYKTSPHIAIPQYTYDVYSISGEGTGGMFRPYRGDVGYIYDHDMQTRSNSGNFSFDLGGGAYFKGGVDINVTDAFTRNSKWSSTINSNIAFRNPDSTFQSVYFRNPGEKTTNDQEFYQSVANDSLVRVILGGDSSNVKALNALQAYSNKRPVREIPISQAIVKKRRDKRSQVISYKTAEEASLYGVDKYIRSYTENAIPIGSCADSSLTPFPRYDGITRKKHHLSEISVLNQNGRRYVYGLPAYNVEQDDVTFAVDAETNQNNIGRGVVTYAGGIDNSVNNSKGKDHFYSRDIMPAYAHSFLLTSILSPDYVDVTGDGVTDDDLGDAVKFNYTMVYGADKGYYLWRTPTDSCKANYNEGLKTYRRDDKATYMFGKKEVWYLNSIESKTMIAVFVTSADRDDDLGVKDENGAVDYSKRLRKLDRIDLYSKADLVKNGTELARPIKSVLFDYGYDLCKNAPNSIPGQGKLTLKKIWFTYNGNFKLRKNPYEFYYHPDSNKQPLDSYNPTHNSKHYDRWGNFKYPGSNPGGLNNIDYPYAVQNKDSADKYASVWNLTDIRLPSGGSIKVTYESDDYSYVQNKRALQFFTIAGFANTATDQPQKYLYFKIGNLATDYNYVFADVNTPVQSKSDIYSKYLEGTEKLYFKIAVRMPTDRWGSGFEWVPCYAEVDDYGSVTGNNKRLWFKLKPVDGKSPLALASIQFLRLNLPSKAYPTSELGDNIDLGDAVKMLISSVGEIKNSVQGFYENARSKSWCREVDLPRSFVRLDCPGFTKYGGGQRVKRIELFDNWNKMTTQKEASYGQEYTYTTTRKVAGQEITISSGVASYEPFIGNEENPFHQPIEYKEKLSVLAPTNYLYSERPLGESYFPSAMVGYSKVRVRTIHTKAKSANGWQETEFYTTKDFPTLTDFTPLDGSNRKRYNPKLRNFFHVNAVQNLTISQGFKVELNDMNGKVKAQASYAETDSVHPINYVANFYKVDNDSVMDKHLSNQVWTVDSANGKVNLNGTIGKDIEMMMDLREQYSQTHSQNNQVNLDVIPSPFLLLPPVLFIPTYFPGFQGEQNTFRSIATVKIVQRYGILDSVVVIDKGSFVSTKNLVYDGETGEVVVSRTNNEFNDPVYNFSYPAYWAYSGMGPAYRNIDAVFINKRCINGKLFNQDGSPFNSEKFFESGDEIWAAGYENYSTVSRPDDCPLYQFIPIPTNRRIWAIDAAKGKEKKKGIYFIDSLGKAYHAQVLSMKIIRSGKRNMLDASVGSIVSLANPVREITQGQFKIVLDTLSRVIQASAAVYKDIWQVENSQYAIDSCYTVFVPAVYSIQAKVSLFRQRLESGNGGSNVTTVDNSTKYAVASVDYVRSRSLCGHHSFFYRTKAVLSFDLSQLPANTIIDDASLRFITRVPQNLWTHEEFRYGCVQRNSDWNYDWPNVSADHLGTYTSALRRLTQNWNNSFTYAALKSITTTSNQTLISSVSGQNPQVISCTNLIRDMVQNPAGRYNMVMELTNENQQSTNFVSFSGVNEGAPNSGCDLETGFKCSYIAPTLDLQCRIPTTTCVKVCRNNISDSAVNPYRWGILGNWRTDRAYTYYGDRKENNALNSDTDIRKEGELKNFQSYWNFTSNGIVNTTDTSIWVWNAATSRFNRRGFELENYDPLGRYNSGIYGYNQTVPVAVAQNSRYREILFDGFEDYLFQNQQCIPLCVKQREFDFVTGMSGVSLDATTSHTGNYSLKVNVGAEAKLTVPIVSPVTDTLSSSLSIRVDSTPVYTSNVVGAGSGLTGSYRSALLSGGTCGSTFTFLQSRLDPEINFHWGLGSPITGMCPFFYTVQWLGRIQPRYSGRYSFYAIHDGQLAIAINGLTIIQTSTSGTNKGQFDLQAGQLYTIAISYTHFGVPFTSGSSHISLEWESAQQVRQFIPSNFLYPPTVPLNQEPPGSIIRTITDYCIKLNNIQSQQVIRPYFSPVQGTKMVLSGWIRLDGTDCNTAPALTDALQVSFDAGGAGIIYPAKTGVRIEGWQRYEGVINIPSNATKMYISAKGTQGKTIYADDIRMHPFNSNAKSYVYDAVSMRLISELDENNYATYYEYDDDGTLVRVKKETERGVKTIKETRSALIRDDN